jgi:hypothetical protein
MPLPGARHAGYAPTPAMAWLPIAAAAVIGLATAGLAARWTRAPGWGDRHTAAAITAALLGHTLIGLLTLVHTPLDRAALVAFGVAEAALLAALVRHVAARPHPAGNEYLHSGARSAAARPWQACSASKSTDAPLR